MIMSIVYDLVVSFEYKDEHGDDRKILCSLTKDQKYDWYNLAVSREIIDDLARIISEQGVGVLKVEENTSFKDMTSDK